MEDCKVPIQEQYIINTDTSKQDITRAFHELLQLKKRPSAICAGADSIALNLIDDAIQEKLQVPEDISIIGIDNVDLSRHGSVVT